MGVELEWGLLKYMCSKLGTNAYKITLHNQNHNTNIYLLFMHYNYNNINDIELILYQIAYNIHTTYTKCGSFIARASSRTASHK